MSHLLQKAWDDGSCCSECPHYHEWKEHHPYGSTTAAEMLAECKAEDENDCPWIELQRKDKGEQLSFNFD